MAESIDSLNLKIAQLVQIVDQYRVNMYNDEMRLCLLLKIMEEKGIIVPGEFDKRWPLYLKNDVGVPDSNGFMEGSLKIKMYEN